MTNLKGEQRRWTQPRSHARPSEVLGKSQAPLPLHLSPPRSTATTSHPRVRTSVSPLRQPQRAQGRCAGVKVCRCCPHPRAQESCYLANRQLLRGPSPVLSYLSCKELLSFIIIKLLKSFQLSPKHSRNPT